MASAVPRQGRPASRGGLFMRNYLPYSNCSHLLAGTLCHLNNANPLVLSMQWARSQKSRM